MTSLMVLAGLLHGCAVPAAPAPPGIRPRPALVALPAVDDPGLGPDTAALSPGTLPQPDRFPASWELSRNDAALGVDRGAGVAFREVVEIRTRDHRRTLNGRVSESSRTITRTLRRGLLRGP